MKECDIHLIEVIGELLIGIAGPVSEGRISIEKYWSKEVIKEAIKLMHEHDPGTELPEVLTTKKAVPGRPG